MNIDHAASGRKPISLEKFREDWLRSLVLHRGIKGSTLRVAIVIAYHINRQTRLAFPGVRTIRKLTGLSLSTISAAINWLAANRYIQIQRGRTRNATNRYMPLGKTEHPVRPVRTPAFAPGGADLPTYLPKEPPSYKAAACAAATKEGIREERKKPLSTEAQCFNLARQSYGPTASALVSKALRTLPASEVLEEIQNAIETGNDLGHALWRP
jgi:hypothetical protein